MNNQLSKMVTGREILARQREGFTKINNELNNIQNGFAFMILKKYLIEPSGLPKGNLCFALKQEMIRWDSKTGEVSTIEYMKE